MSTGKSRREQIVELLEADPGDSFLRYGLAMDYASADEDEKAAECFAELLRRDPGYVAGYFQGGKVLAKLGRDDEARDVLRAGIGVARSKGDDHAAGEMTGFLQSLE